MNIVIIRVVLALLLLAVVVAVLHQTDRRLERIMLGSAGRMAVALGVMAVALAFVCSQSAWWLCAAWLLLSAAVATGCYCRRTWLAIPIYISMVPTTMMLGGIALVMMGLPNINSWLWVPVTMLLQAAALPAGRRGLAVYAYNRKAHASMHDYLLGNGATAREALRPFVARAMQRALAPLWQKMRATAWALLPLSLGGLLTAGMQPVDAVVAVAALTLALLCGSVLTVLLSILTYEKMRQA